MKPKEETVEKPNPKKALKIAILSIVAIFILWVSSNFLAFWKHDRKYNSGPPIYQDTINIMNYNQNNKAPPNSQKLEDVE